MARAFALAWLSYLAVALGLQIHSGVFRAELSGSDEASHFMNGLMARDYITQGFPGGPIAYAREYYLHYPKVAIGHWPPGFAALLGAWMIPAASATAAMSLIAALMSLIAALVFHGARSEGAALWIAWPAGLLAVVSPLGRTALNEVMIEPLCAVLMFWCAILYARYLDSGGMGAAIRFGVWSGIALLVKPNAAALALLPVLCVILGRRWDLPKRISFWAPAAIVLAMTVPWYAWSWRWLEGEWLPGGRDTYLARAAKVIALTPRFGGALTFTIIALGAAGWIAMRGKAPSRSAAYASLAIAVLLLHMVISPHLDPRHYLLAVAPALVGTGWALARLPRAAAAAVAAALLALCGIPALPPKLDTGMAAAADFLEGERGVWLVSSDSNGEGSFVTAIALREQRPSSYVVRGTKLLSEQMWMGQNYRLLYSSAQELAEALDRWPVGAVVIDGNPRSVIRHSRVLEEALTLRPDDWRAEFRTPLVTVWKRTKKPPALTEEFRRELAGRLQIAWR